MRKAQAGAVALAGRPLYAEDTTWSLWSAIEVVLNNAGDGGKWWYPRLLRRLQPIPGEQRVGSRCIRRPIIVKVEL